MHLVFVAALVACVSAQAEMQSPFAYHRDVGVPLAAKIKESEDNIMKTRAANRVPATEFIIGGVMAPANAHPHFAGLLVDLPIGESVCGATLVSTNRLVTAAHCWFDGQNQARRFTVVLGTQFLRWGGERYATSQVFMHPQYQTWNLLNDVAMIYLPVHVQVSASIRPVALPNSSQQWQTFAGYWATAAGFGITRDGQQEAATALSQVSLQVVTNEYCNWRYPPGWVFPSTLCTSGISFGGNVGVCRGDSGGPLTVQMGGQPVLIGISSFAATNACEWGFPSGFARVSSFLNFIHQHLR